MNVFSRVVCQVFILSVFGFSVLGQEKSSLITNIYSVPPQLLTGLPNFNRPAAGGAADPFAEPEPESASSKVRGRETVQDLMTNTGIIFGEGASAVFNPKTLKLKVTNGPKEIEKVEILLDAMRSSAEKLMHIHMEFIEVDHKEFSTWLFENRMDSDGTELRKEAQEWIKAGRAEIIDSATVTSRSGQRAKTESIEEYIYPTEYDPAEIPNKVVLKDGAEAPMTAVTPTAFETRNLGTTLEVDPVLGADNITVDLNLAPEIVKLEEVNHWHRKIEDPRFMTNMPTFYTMRITTQLTMQDGRYMLLGTTRPLESADPERKNPIVLQFVRADVSSTADWSKD